ncbi:MAG: family 16 glycoside hydrolase [Ferruginibacter sp.]
MKYKLFISITLFAVLLACNNANKNSTTNSAVIKATAEDTTGWISLFDGKTTAGWHSYGKTTVGDAWKVADGTLYLDTITKSGWQTTGGDLCTADEYENFDPYILNSDIVENKLKERVPPVSPLNLRNLV